MATSLPSTYPLGNVGLRYADEHNIMYTHERDVRVNNPEFFRRAGIDMPEVAQENPYDYVIFGADPTSEHSMCYFGGYQKGRKTDVSEILSIATPHRIVTITTNVADITAQILIEDPKLREAIPAFRMNNRPSSPLGGVGFSILYFQEDLCYEQTFEFLTRLHD